MDLTVKFPVTPYSVQVSISNLLYDCLEKGTKICLVQSPTGTGKSYSILVGLTSWILDNKYKPRKTDVANTAKLPSWIKKSSNQQTRFIEGEKRRIQQRLQEIKNSNISAPKIRPKISLKVQQKDFIDEQIQSSQHKRKIKDSSVPEFALPRIIFTSRTHSQLTQIVESFNNLKTSLIGVSIASKKHLCINKSVKSKANPELECSKLLEKQGCAFYSKQSHKEFLSVDIEQSMEIGNKHSICPYYSLKSVLDVADISCVPYASILSKQIRAKIGIDIKNSIVVFDEAHNVIQNQLDSRSVELKHSQLRGLHELLSSYQAKYHNLFKSRNRHNLSQLIHLLEQVLNTLQRKYNSKTESSETEKVQSFLLDLSSCEINIALMKRYVQQTSLNNKIYSSEKQVDPYLLVRFVEMIEEIILNSDSQTRVLYKYGKSLQETAIKVMAFNIVKLDEVVSSARMVVFAGGTLSPLDSFQPLLSKYSHVCEEYQHVIGDQQCKVYLLQRFRQKEISFTHLTKSSPETLQAIKSVIEKALTLTKQGIVVFLQSYAFLQTVKAYIVQHCDFREYCVFDSPTNPKVFSVYQQRIRKGEQSILLSVMGGKLSEGINFSDSLARLLVVFGLPYPDTRTPEMKLKTSFNQAEYINNLCMRSVNQTIGRAIRHSEDWANIILVDSRFSRLQSKLPQWMRNRVSTVKDIQLIK